MIDLYSHPGVALRQHLLQVGQGMRQNAINEKVHLKFLDNQLLQELSYLIGISHDFGKGTTFFQKYLDRKSQEFSQHALISSFFIKVLVEKWANKNNLPKWLPVVAHLAIRWHHGNLSSPEYEISKNQIRAVTKQVKNINENTLSSIQTIYESLLKGFDIDFKELFSDLEREVKRKKDDFLGEYEQELSIDVGDEKVFLFQNYIFSLLIDVDKKCAADLETEYFHGATNFNVSVKKHLESLRKKYPKRFSPNIPINSLRNQFLDEVIDCKELHPKNRIYTLTAPTGIGKTFAAFEAANRLKVKLGGNRRIIYCLPFTSIIDQTYDEIENIFKNQIDNFPDNQTKYLLKHHYLADMTLHRRSDKKKGEYSYQDPRDRSNYLRDRMVTETWESGIIVTTFVQFFHTLIGYRNRTLKKFHNMTNSVIVLDEVQNIPVRYHKLVGQMLSSFADMFDSYVILMTATQPALFEQLEDIEPVQLIKNPENYFHDEDKIFDRVDLHFLHDLMSPLPIENLQEMFIDTFNGDNVLVVFNTKKSAVRFYSTLKEVGNFSEYKFICLTTYQTPRDRRILINCIKRTLKKNINAKIICVATQLVEAGVDFSFQYVYRDFGPMDSIIQVTGRCNRNGEFPRKGKFYLMRLEDENNKVLANYVYKDRYLTQSTNDVLKDAGNTTASTDFLSIGNFYFDKLAKAYKVESDILLNAIKKLDYNKISTFELIENQPGQVDIIICQNSGIESLVRDTIPHLIQKIVEHPSDDPFNKDRQKLFGDLIKKKRKLSDYTITIYENDLEYYERAKTGDIFEISWGKGERYIPYSSVNQRKGYNSATGFIYDPIPSETTHTAMT